MKPQQIFNAPRTYPGRDNKLGDLRFRALLPDGDWFSLPLGVRRRFSRRLSRGDTIVYVGEVLETKMSKVGWGLAQAARLFGGPFPLANNAHVPSVVTVTEDPMSDGQIWTRLYESGRGFPQVIHSCKRFEGPTGLEEYVGRGVGMALSVQVRDGVLIFRSKHYFLQILGRRFILPAWLTPGVLSVTHAEVADGNFTFVLEVVHPRFGMLIRQLAIFRETLP